MKEQKGTIHKEDGITYKMVDGKKVFILEKEPKPEDIFKNVKVKKKVN